MESVIDKPTTHTPTPWTYRSATSALDWIAGPDDQTVQWRDPDHPDRTHLFNAVHAHDDLVAFVDTVQARALDLCKAIEQGDFEGISLIASALRDESTAALAKAESGAA